MPNKLSQSSIGVAHHSPGRTRLKVPKTHRNSKEMHKVKSALSAVPGIKNVEVNHETGSILVQHDHDMHIFDAIEQSFEAVAGDMLVTLIEGERAEAMGVIGLFGAATGLVSGMAKNLMATSDDERIGFLKRRASDTKNLLPLAFLAAAAYKAYETRSFWSGTTPMVLAYWAFDSYWKLNCSGYPAAEAKNNGHSHNN